MKQEGRAVWNGGKMMEVKRSEQVEKQEDGGGGECWKREER